MVLQGDLLSHSGSLDMASVERVRNLLPVEVQQALIDGLIANTSYLALADETLIQIAQHQTLALETSSHPQTSDQISRQDIVQYLLYTQQSPSFQMLRQRTVEAARYIWLLDILRQVRATSPEVKSIQRVHKPDSETFYSQYVCRGLPVVITHAIDHWPAFQNWSFQTLRERIGHVTMSVEVNREKDVRYDQHPELHVKRMPMADLIDRIEAVESSQASSNDFYLTSRSKPYHDPDWQVILDDAPLLTDYLNPCDDGSEPVLWLGPRGARTQMHYDTMNSMHVNILGRKRFLLADPCYDPSMYSYNGIWSRIPFPDEADLERYPKFKNVQFIEVILEPGDVLFLPMLWWHAVEILEPALSFTYGNLKWKEELAGCLGFQEIRAMDYLRDGK